MVQKRRFFTSGLCLTERLKKAGSAQAAMDAIPKRFVPDREADWHWLVNRVYEDNEDSQNFRNKSAKNSELRRRQKWPYYGGSVGTTAHMKHPSTRSAKLSSSTHPSPEIEPLPCSEIFIWTRRRKGVVDPDDPLEGFHSVECRDMLHVILQNEAAMAEAESSCGSNVASTHLRSRLNKHDTSLTKDIWSETQ